MAKLTKHFEFQTPYGMPTSQNGQRKVEQLGKLEISGVCYKQDGEVSYDIENILFYQPYSDAKPVEVKALFDMINYKCLQGDAVKEEIIDNPTQSHCEWLFANEEIDADFINDQKHAA